MVSPSSADALVLLVEGDRAVARMLTDLLLGKGYGVQHAPTAAAARALLGEFCPDLIVLELLLPDADGLLLCADLRQAVDAPVIVCSASTSKRDRVLSLKLGADDFIAKPFDADELLARVEAVLRRARSARALQTRPQPASPDGGKYAPAERWPRSANGRCQVGGLVLEPARRRVTLGGRPLPLTPTEYRLLAALLSRPDEVLSRDELGQCLWGRVDRAASRAVDVHIRRLRAKLVAAGARPSPIVTVRGRGYRLAATETAALAA